jgi:lipoprotein-anchoring transpeptidase ErfK/SrfK
VATVGGVVKPGDSVVEIVPSEDRLIIEAHLPISDIGYVQAGQRAVIKLASRDARRFGHLEGKVFVTSDGPMPLHPDCRYEVTVNADLTEFTLAGPRHREVTAHSSFQTITTPAPLFSHETQIVAIDEPIVVEFNTPIKAFAYELSPEISSSSSIDESNPSRAYITLSSYEQGQKYDLTITEARGQNGASLKQPYTQKVATTEPLRVVFVPGDGEAGVSQGERPTLTFTEKIRNPEETEQLLSLEPSTLGTWTWVTPDKLEFKPLQEWTKGTKVTIRLKGGPEGFRGESGSFLRQDVESSFTIRPSKIIDVNLSEQRVYAYDNDQLVRTMICSSGSMATPSLTGTYAVYAKAEKVDMRGADYFAPNVPWVLMFNGDYTIHGNYWATSFGIPTSHGCVGLPLSDAEWLYNWTPLGTIVQIHY